MPNFGNMECVSAINAGTAHDRLLPRLPSRRPPWTPLLACTDGNRARIPARIFCAVCGHFHGYSEAEPPTLQEKFNKAIDATVKPPVTSLADGFSMAAQLWKHVGRLAGGVW